MDWLFHILIALIIFNPYLSLPWFLLGSILFDIFFIISFTSVAGLKPRSLKSMLTFENKASKTVWHKIGYIGHGLPAMLIFLLFFIFGNKQISSLAIGIVFHQVIDLMTHKAQPNPLMYPISLKRYSIGFAEWSIQNKERVFQGLLVVIALLTIKYGLFGFII